MEGNKTIPNKKINWCYMLLARETGKIDCQIIFSFSFSFNFLILYFPCNFCMEMTFFVSTINVSGLQDVLSMPTSASIIIASILVQIPLAWNLQSKKWQAVQEPCNLVPFPLLVAINSVTSSPWSSQKIILLKFRRGREGEEREKCLWLRSDGFFFILKYFSVFLSVIIIVC